MKVLRGVAAYPGFAVGPAFVVSTWNDLLSISMTKMPVVVVAPYLEERQIEMIDLRHVYGFIVDHGSVIDPVHQHLSEVTKPSLVGCLGAYEAIETGRTVAIDTDEEMAVLDPEPRLVAYYEELRGTRARRLEPIELDVLQRLAQSVRAAWLYKGHRPPLDMPDEGGRLLAIARKVAGGEPPSPEDDAYVKGLMEPPPAPPAPELPPIRD